MNIGERTFEFGQRTYVMGVLNLTPDSFSDGGRYVEPEKAVEQALRMEADGADIIDMGGESSRPGSDPVTEDEELKRVIPVIEKFTGRFFFYIYRLHLGPKMVVPIRTSVAPSSTATL